MMKKLCTQLRRCFSTQLWLAPLLLILGGLCWRGWHIQNVRIDFDQVQILENAHKILAGDFTLIGPRTGPASMFTGPLIYYLSAPIVGLFGDLAAVALLPLFLSLLTGICLFWLTQHYFDRRLSLVVTTLWAFSPLMIFMERTLWNPNLTLLSASLLFLPLLSERQDRWQKWLVFLGAWLTYQAHFSGFVLLALALILAIFKQKSWRLSLVIIGGFILSLMPTILFDLRNNFLNLHGILDFAQGEKSGGNFFLSVIHTVYLLLQNWGNLFCFGIGEIIAVIVGGGFLLASVIWERQNKWWRWQIIWLLGIALSYSFYHGDMPAYYFIIAVPAFLFLSAKLLLRLPKKIMWTILVLWLITTVPLTYRLVKDDFGASLINLQKTKIFLRQAKAQDLVIDLKFGTDYGWQYFKKQINFTDGGPIYHLADGDGFNRQKTLQLSNLLLWQDLRQADYNYEEGSSYLLGVPNNYSLTKINNDAFALKNEDIELATIERQTDDCVETQTEMERIWLVDNYCFKLTLAPNSPTELFSLSIQVLP